MPIPFSTTFGTLPMSGGKSLDKSRANWQNFKRLRAIRNELAIHLKQPALGFSHEQLSELLNVFCSGIAGLFCDLHLVFDKRIPSQIIRYTYLPNIKLVETDDC